MSYNYRLGPKQMFAANQFIDIPYSFPYWKDGVPGGVNMKDGGTYYSTILSISELSTVHSIFYIIYLSLFPLIAFHNVIFCFTVRESFDLISL